jgi:hypothetical protein
MTREVKDVFFGPPELSEQHNIDLKVSRLDEPLE